MDTRDFVTLTLLAAGGQVHGKTKLQKLVYFLGVLTDHLEELGYRPHFYGPYSDEVAYAVGQLRAIGVVEVNDTNHGCNYKGFEVIRSDFRLNDAGRKFAEDLKRKQPASWTSIEAAMQKLLQTGEKDYVELSIAAKTYFLIVQAKGNARSESDLAKLAPRFGWDVQPDQISNAGRYLENLGLFKVRSPAQT